MRYCDDDVNHVNLQLSQIQLAREMLTCYNTRKHRKRGRNSVGASPSLVFSDYHFPRQARKACQMLSMQCIWIETLIIILLQAMQWETAHTSVCCTMFSHYISILLSRLLQAESNNSIQDHLACNIQTKMLHGHQTLVTTIEDHRYTVAKVGIL